jgi:F-box interacting protein
LRYKQYRGRLSEFHGFHVAGAGAGISSSNAPMRAIFGDSYLGYRCVNTCNGVVLLATNDYSPLGRCVLWNPAVADVVREFTVPADPSMEGGDINYLMLGLGYGRRSETYKLLLFRMDYTHWKHSLQVYALVGGQPRLRPAVSSPPGIDGAIQSQESLYMDGTVYLLDVDRSVILAFDVDDETVTTIRLPGKLDRDHPRHVRSRLMEMQGRLCLATNHGHHHRAGLWLLAADRRQWERRCVIELQGSVYYHDSNGDTYHCSIAGVWDCSGVLAVHIQGLTVANNKLCLYQLATGRKMLDAKLPCDLVPDDSHYALCWGYKRTLVSAQSILELSQDEERRRNIANAKDIMEALKPIRDKDSREGPKAILDTVSFMEFLVSVMRKLPDDVQDVIKLPLLLDSVDLDVVSENDSEDSEDDDARGVVKIRIVSGSDSD